MNTSPTAIFESLKRIAPNLAFKVKRAPDYTYVWDGDGPDPADEGYVAYDVDVIVRAIEDGEVLEGMNSLGGSYDLPGKFDPDIQGYLPQMLQEAVEELKDQVTGENRIQAIAAEKYLDEVLTARYEEGQQEEYKRRMQRKRWSPQEP